jgi:capsular exopolysaccharide synthesis family protein
MEEEKVDKADSTLAQPMDGSPLESLLQVVLRHRWIILISTLLFVVGAFLYLAKATPIYTSSSRVYVEQTGPKIINEYEGVMTRSNNYLYLQGELIRSTPILSAIADDPEMRYLRTFEGVDNLVAWLKKELKIGVGKRDDIITVCFDSPYPTEAARIVNAVVDAYVKYQSTRQRSTVSEVLSILQKEKVRRDEELSGRLSKMLEFTRENGIVSFDTKGGNIVLERLSTLSGALTEAQLATLNAKADFEAVTAMKDEPAKIKQFAEAATGMGTRVLINDRESQLRAELRTAEAELMDARYHCTEDHPSIQALHAKIGRIKQDLDGQAKEFADAYMEVVRLRWVTAQERANELQESFDQQRGAARDLGIKATEYNVLQSELSRAERICEILDGRIKELNVTEDVGALNISILDVARPADNPSRPRRARAVAMALVLGAILGCGLAFLRDWLDSRLRSAEEVSAVLGLPVIGIVPTMSHSRKRILSHSERVWLKLKSVAAALCLRRRAEVCASPASEGDEGPPLLARAAAHRQKRATRLRGTLPGREAILVGGPAESAGTGAGADRGPVVTCDRSTVGGSSTDVASAAGKEDKTRMEKQHYLSHGQVVCRRPKSAVAEAYRTIRTAVFFGSVKRQAKLMLVTSPAPGDGKSTLVSNLAIAMAQAGQRTLVVDADFRRPVQHKIFEADAGRGMSDILIRRCTIDEAVQPGPVKGLDILPCGTEVPNPSELLNSDAFAQVLSELSERYARIVIDSPPVGPVADGQILATMCDVVLLVLRAEQSTRRQSRHARDALLSVGAHILGVILNDVPRAHGWYGHYSGYGYGYYSGYGDREEKAG